MPVLNLERFIGEAIDSVTRQTFTDWELVIVDDGSIDASLSISGGRAEADPRIRLLTHPNGANRGAAASRNLGIRNACGSLIGFLDGDDVYRPDALANANRIFDAEPDVDVVYGATHWWSDAGDIPPYIEKAGVEPDRIYRPSELVRRVLLDKEGDIPCTCAVFIRKEAADAVGGFEERFRLYEDQSLWAKLFLSHPVYVASAVMAGYRQHDASTSSRAIAAGQYHPHRPHEAHRAFLEWLDRLIVTRGDSDEALGRAVARELATYRHPVRTRLARGARRVIRLMRRHLTPAREPS